MLKKARWVARSNELSRCADGAYKPLPKDSLIDGDPHGQNSEFEVSAHGSARWMIF